MVAPSIPLLVAADGTLHVFFSSSNPLTVYQHGIRDGNGWTFQTDPDFNFMMALAVDPTGTLYRVTSRDAPASFNNLALETLGADGAWTSQAIPGVTTGVVYPGMFQIGTDGTLHLLYLTGPPGQYAATLYHVQCAAGNWSQPELLAPNVSLPVSGPPFIQLAIHPADQRIFTAYDLASGFTLSTRLPGGPWQSLTLGPLDFGFLGINPDGKCECGVYQGVDATLHAYYSLFVEP